MFSPRRVLVCEVTRVGSAHRPHSASPARRCFRFNSARSRTPPGIAQQIHRSPVRLRGHNRLPDARNVATLVPADPSGPRRQQQRPQRRTRPRTAQRVRDPLMRSSHRASPATDSPASNCPYTSRTAAASTGSTVPSARYPNDSPQRSLPSLRRRLVRTGTCRSHFTSISFRGNRGEHVRQSA